MRRLLVTLLSVTVLGLSAVPAFAHARLVSSVPVGGSTVTISPPEIVLEFNERIEADFGGVQVFDASATRLPSGEPVISDKTVKMSLDKLPAAGDYTVVFRIISGDSHPVESRFAFRYEPPPQPSPVVSETVPEPAESEAPPATQPDEEPASGGMPIGVIVVGVIVLVVAALAVRRSKKSPGNKIEP